jgi:LAO/AO transport system kinase
MTMSNRISLEEWVKEIQRGNTVWLAQAITLAESARQEDRQLAESLIEALLPSTGHAVRIGITGAPGAGKSTFIEALGLLLTGLGKKMAVLTIDPTSEKTKGSILGDKTRMEALSKKPMAFIRPSPSGLALGGVAERTREAILLCEAAGFEIILVETVGVGQSETAVRGMVDFFLLLMLAGAGDELQGIKKGIMEMADGVIITKADGDNLKKARQAQADFQYALNLFSDSDSGWKPKVLITSALENTGIDKTWELVEQYVMQSRSSGVFDRQRSRQTLQWFQESMQAQLKEKLWQSETVKSKIQAMEEKVVRNEILPSKAAREIITGFLNHLS